MRSPRRRFFTNLPLTSSFVLLLGCSSVVGTDDRVEVRVRNASTADFSSVVIGFPDQTEAYGAVAAQSATEYREVGRAYRYAAVQVALNGTSLVLIPVDYVGEEELDGGSYTYELNLTDDMGSLTLRLVVD